eukprot:gene8051-biopygen21115
MPAPPPGGTGQWRGRGAGMARATGIFWLGVARAWRRHGAGISCSPRPKKMLQPAPAGGLSRPQTKGKTCGRDVGSRIAGSLPKPPSTIKELPRCFDREKQEVTVTEVCIPPRPPPSL